MTEPKGILPFFLIISNQYVLRIRFKMFTFFSFNQMECKSKIHDTKNHNPIHNKYFARQKYKLQNFQKQIKTKRQGEKKRTLRVQSQSPLNDIDGVVILGLEPPVIALSDCLIDLHVP